MNILFVTPLNPQSLNIISIILIVLCFSACKKESTTPQNGNSELTTPQIYYNLKMLSVGLHGANNVVNNNNRNKKNGGTLLTDIIYSECAKGMDGFYFSNYKRIAEAAEAENINLTELMNAAISDAYGLPDSIDHAGNLINGEENYYAFVPFLKDISNAPENNAGYLDLDDETLTNLTASPLMGYMHLESDYPLPGVEVDEDMYMEQIDITRSGALQKLAVITISQVNEVMECYFYRDVECDGPNSGRKELKLCSATNYQCSYCNSNPHANSEISSYPNWGQYGGGNLMNYEIAIHLDYHSSHISTNQLNRPSCYQSGDILLTQCYIENSQPNITNGFQHFGDYYAKLSKVGSYKYLKVHSSYIEKVDHPIHWRVSENLSCQNQVGPYQIDDLYLCNRQTRFYSLGEYLSLNQTPTGMFGLAQGGVYKIKQGNLPSLYFAFPWNINFWYSNIGPDMRIAACTEYCADNTSVKPEYNNYGTNAFSERWLTTFGEDKNILMTTNFYEITNFWDETCLWVSFGPGNYHSSLVGHREKFPSNNQTESTPPTNLNDYNLLGVIGKNVDNLCDNPSLTWTYNQSFDISNYIDQNSIVNFLLKVEVCYEDPVNSFVQYRVVGINNTTPIMDGGDDVFCSIFIKGKDWTNYKVSVYAL